MSKYDYSFIYFINEINIIYKNNITPVNPPFLIKNLLLNKTNQDQTYLSEIKNIFDCCKFSESEFIPLQYKTCSYYQKIYIKVNDQTNNQNNETFYKFDIYFDGRIILSNSKKIKNNLYVIDLIDRQEHIDMSLVKKKLKSIGMNDQHFFKYLDTFSIFESELYKNFDKYAMVLAKEPTTHNTHLAFNGGVYLLCDQTVKNITLYFEYCERLSSDLVYYCSKVYGWA